MEYGCHHPALLHLYSTTRCCSLWTYSTSHHRQQPCSPSFRLSPDVMQHPLVALPLVRTHQQPSHRSAQLDSQHDEQYHPPNLHSTLRHHPLAAKRMDHFGLLRYPAHTHLLHPHPQIDKSMNHNMLGGYQGEPFLQKDYDEKDHLIASFTPLMWLRETGMDSWQCLMMSCMVPE